MSCTCSLSAFCLELLPKACGSHVAVPEGSTEGPPSSGFVQLMNLHQLVVYLQIFALNKQTNKRSPLLEITLCFGFLYFAFKVNL